MLQHNYDYRSCLDASQRISWRIDDVVAGRTFDFRKLLAEAVPPGERARRRGR